MKCIFVLILTAAAISAADFNTGQAARAVVGQITFTQGDDGASDVLLGAAGGVAYANNTLFVADGSRSGATPVNNRVLIYQNVAGWLPSPSQPLNYDRKCPVCVGDADVVVGQPDFTHTDIALSQTGMRTPTAVASDGIHLVVADTDNNRVLIWNSIPTVNGAPPTWWWASRISRRVPSPPATCPRPSPCAARRESGSKTASSSWRIRRTTAS